MRKLPAILAAVGLSALTLTGCSVLTVAGDACERPASESTVSSFVTVTGEIGAMPSISTIAPVRVSESGFADLVVGDGLALTDDAQLAVVAVSLFHGETGDLIYSSRLAGEPEQATPVSTWVDRLPGLGPVLDCATAGTRVLAALDYDGVGEWNAPNFGVSESQSVIAVVDVVDTYLTRATGERRFVAGHGLPSVVRGPDGRPGVSIPDVPAPTELVTQVLIEGEGDPVADGDAFLVHFTALTWDERTVFDSSWGRAPGLFALDGALPGLEAALDGQRVGSQVLVVVPPELGFGDNPADFAGGAVPGGSTLVFVFDILGIVTPAE